MSREARGARKGGRRRPAVTSRRDSWLPWLRLQEPKRPMLRPMGMATAMGSGTRWPCRDAHRVLVRLLCAAALALVLGACSGGSGHEPSTPLDAACESKRSRAFTAADSSKYPDVSRAEAERQVRLFITETRAAPDCFAASVHKEAEAAEAALQRGELSRLRGTVGLQ